MLQSFADGSCAVKITPSRPWEIARPAAAGAGIAGDFIAEQNRLLGGKGAPC